jgi:deoxyribonuclease-4
LKIFLGPAGTPTITKGGSESGILDVAKLGLNAMEIQFTFGVKMGKETAEKIGKLAAEKGVRLSIHAPYYINLCQQDKAKLEKSKQWILLSAERAAELGAKVIVFHPGAYGKLSSEQAVEYVISVCEQLAKKTEVILGFETTGKKGQFGTLDEIIEICKKVKGCTPVIDFAHIFARNGGNIDYEEIFRKVSVLHLNSLHCHFSGINYGPKGERNHLPIMVNRPNFSELARTILKHKKDITIICESPLLERDSLVMKRIFEKLGYKFN